MSLGGLFPIFFQQRVQQAQASPPFCSHQVHPSQTPSPLVFFFLYCRTANFFSPAVLPMCLDLTLRCAQAGFFFPFFKALRRRFDRSGKWFLCLLVFLSAVRALVIGRFLVYRPQPSVLKLTAPPIRRFFLFYPTPSEVRDAPSLRPLAGTESRPMGHMCFTPFSGVREAAASCRESRSAHSGAPPAKDFELSGCFFFAGVASIFSVWPLLGAESLLGPPPWDVFAPGRSGAFQFRSCRGPVPRQFSSLDSYYNMKRRRLGSHGFLCPPLPDYPVFPFPPPAIDPSRDWLCYRSSLYGSLGPRRSPFPLPRNRSR